MTQIKSLTDII